MEIRAILAELDQVFACKGYNLFGFNCSGANAFLVGSDICCALSHAFRCSQTLLASALLAAPFKRGLLPVVGPLASFRD